MNWNINDFLFLVGISIFFFELFVRVCLLTRIINMIWKYSLCPYCTYTGQGDEAKTE